ncbi:MAG: hypothetical protein IPN00_10820 [Hydrogenophilales bacterium]|nr:hypothetical protein [Hydrogenophilales bacterium]
MNRRKFLTRAIALWLSLSASAQALAEARVRVDTDAEFIRVVAEIETRVDRNLAWRVLSDYGRWAEFVPDLQVSRVISSPDEPIRLEQRGRIPWLPNFPLVMITQVKETPPRSIQFLRVAGNVRSFMGEWQILGKNPVRLVYRSLIEPGFALPPEVSIEIFRHDAKVRLEAMAREMARRAAAEGNPPPR